jgi:hypothetical protein
MKNIKLNTRGDNNYLEYIEDNKYKLVAEYPYIRVLFKDNPDDIYAVDPPSGPFIQVGNKLNEVGKIVESITRDNGFIINFK